MLKKILCVIFISAATLITAFAVGYESTLDELKQGLKDDPENGCFLTLAIRHKEPGADLTDFGLYIAAREIPKNKTTALKYALTLHVCGVKAEKYEEYLSKPENYPENTAGIVFRLHLLSNGYDVKAGADDLIGELASRQREDGGFAVAGDTSDTDLTAMAVAALAPYKDGETAAATVGGAVDFLKRVQKENGAFRSFGEENAETCAQVIIALSSIGDREETLEKALSALDSFRLENGRYEHIHGGGENATATAQCICALAACDTDGPFYTVDCQNAVEYKEDEEKREDGDLTLYFCLGVAAAGAAVCLILAIRKDRRAVDYIIILSVTAVIVTVIAFVGVKTQSGYFSDEQTVEAVGYVTVSVDCSLVSDREMITPRTEPIGEGDTAYSVLMRVCRKNGLTVITSGSSVSPYITAIGGMYEAEYGQTSGWGYKVNGVSPSVGAGAYRLSDGDVLEWIYVPDVSYLYDGAEK